MRDSAADSQVTDSGGTDAATPDGAIVDANVADASDAGTEPVRDHATFAVSYLMSCAIVTSGAVKCWGYNYHGQTNVPASLKQVKMIAAGDGHTCALDEEGVKCWGLNGYGQTDVPK